MRGFTVCCLSVVIARLNTFSLCSSHSVPVSLIYSIVKFHKGHTEFATMKAG